MKKLLLIILFFIFPTIIFAASNSISKTKFDAKKYIDVGYLQDRLEDIDIDGDNKPEKLLTMISQKADRWKMKILSERNGKWKVIKEDQEKRGVGWHDKNPFLLQIYDFGADGKQEVVVSKISWVTLDARDRNIRYYVFGMVDGKLWDFPIPKWYLHTEWFESDSFPKMVSVGLYSDKIVEKYSLLLPSQTWKSMADLQYYTVSIIQNFKKGSFLKNTQKQKENENITNLF